MNRNSARTWNGLLLTAFVLGAGFALVKDRLRGWMVDLKYYSGVESARQRDHEAAVESFKSAAELALMKEAPGLPGFKLDSWIGPVLPERAGASRLQAGIVLEENLEDFKAAEAAYRSVLEESPEGDPAAVEARRRLAAVADRAAGSKAMKEEGKAALARDEARAAQAAFEKAVRLDPGDREARYLLKVAMASGRGSVSKAQAAELLHLSLRARGFDEVRVQFKPFWVRASGKYRESLILDVAQARRRIPELLVPCAEAGGRILDQKLAFDLGGLVIRRHPGSELRPPTFAAFRNDEIYDIPLDILRQYRKGQITDAELIHRLAPPTS